VIGECYFNKWSLIHPQCTITEVGHRKRIGNALDAWTWCRYHGGLVEEPVVPGMGYSVLDGPSPTVKFDSPKPAAPETPGEKGVKHD